MIGFKDFLKKRLNEPLPGINSHLKMTPKMFERSFRDYKPKGVANQSSVLVPIVERNKALEVLFTLRSSKLKHHPGQISFPGGRIEPNESARDASLRETFEEIGINNDKIEVIGTLSDLYVPPSNNIIHSFVGDINSIPEIKMSLDEVEECFYVPLDYFLEPNNLRTRKEMMEGYEVDVPYWDVGKQTKLWGATSMILRELVDLYEEYKNNCKLLIVNC